ncbi:MAG: TonB-dependent receptor [Ignavibacteriaceae bacterium]|nr:TonB-dependent receptor [Ignavibacteriaceae bacterium]
MKIITLIFITLISNLILAQQKLKGTVAEKSNFAVSSPLSGVNIIWKGTNTGTTSNTDGKFEIPFVKESDTLILSYIGYKSEILRITNEKEIEIFLVPEAKQLENVEVVGNTPSIQIDYLGVENKSTITNKELLKAACCTLAESFETNPSIDVSFTDAITGVRQIEMLGLSGIYTQTTVEALPYIRGLLSNVGLSFIPGTWIDLINVSKGVGSVANGYESITGQIDIGLQKPFGVEGSNPLHINLYGDIDQRFEGNMNFRYTVDEHLSSISLFHTSSRKHGEDKNADAFMDMPYFNTVNFMQRWQYLSLTGWESQFGFQIVNNKNESGTINSNTAISHHYKFGSKINLINLYGKTGYVFPEDNHKSFGLQWSYSNAENNSEYGLRRYSGQEKNLYLNFIYQSEFNETNLFRTGISFIYNDLNETFTNLKYDKAERIPGLFWEHTFKPIDELSIVGGVRGDFHNEFGFLFTPRLHIRYSPNPDWVIRGAVGKGFRSSNIFSEYSSSLTSSRSIRIVQSNNFGNGLAQESAWNYGINLTHYFLYAYREGTLSLDFYRTQFDKTTIANLDSNPQEVTFSSVDDGAYSNTIQVEMNFEPLQSFAARIAYKFIESKQLINSTWLEKPFTSKHRALINIGYSTEMKENSSSQMKYDFTIQWFGAKRIPSTKSNPFNYRARETSPSYILVNGQITRTFTELFELYIGVENLFDFRQNNPIIDPANPNGQYFDASLIWGPVSGRMIYAGLRFKM